MNIARVYSRASVGLDAPLVCIEVHLSRGLPAFNLVGLAHTSVREAKERVRSAIMASGFEFPARRITVNLAPADLPKGGGRYDLAIAIGILAAAGLISQQTLHNYELLAELSLTGELRSVNAALPFLMASQRAQRAALIASEQVNEPVMPEHCTVYAAPRLADVYNHLTDRERLNQVDTSPSVSLCPSTPTIDDVIGQHAAKRALEIAAAGGHHMLLCGPPGSGKSMLAQRFMSLLPPLNTQEALQTACIYSAAGVTRSTQHWHLRPFRQPHHTCSSVALIGGGQQLQPGEISLAHHGALFLDELPEFGRSVIDALRQPLETGEVHISRASGSVTYPATFQLIAAMNPSPTGDINDGRSTNEQILRYIGRLSSPLLERFDMQIMVARVPLTEQPHSQEADGQTARLARIHHAREVQYERANKLNAQLSGSDLVDACQLSTQDSRFLHAACEKLGMSMRGLHKVMRVARTVADIEQTRQVNNRQLKEAMQYRAVERMVAQLGRD
ncbi:YifB family Mg chelatase-like AAA ATPase [Aestuariibacter salexigens]|uniref:YifB family Mg chelatase-like AAA ATPase n=1 Tax=Aestuariibacter salexigens TaxID=226010 RepID=UPI00040F656D|nr:YifB family Mg chelatase-like AAA ATPase [Aestuariibacter salexigens]